MKKISTGVPGVDILLNGGFPVGRTVLLSGNCGSGKTTFATQFIYKGLQNKENCLYVTLEEKKEKLIEDALSIKVNLKKYLDSGQLTIIGGSLGTLTYYKNKTKAKADDLINEIRDVIENTNTTRVVIDSINHLMYLFDVESDQRALMASFAAMLEELGCTSLLTCEAKGDNVTWFGFEDFVVDGVMQLKREIVNGIFFRSFAIIKMRGVSHSHLVRSMNLTDDGVVIHPEEDSYLSLLRR